MKSFDQQVESPFYQFMNFLYKIILINILYLFTTAVGLFFFTFAPATIATLVCMKGIYEKKEFPIIRTFFHIFKTEYKKSTLFFVFYLGTFTILGGSFYYYTVSEDILLNTIGLLISGLIIILHLTSFIHFLLISIYTPSISFQSKVKYSYIMIVYKPMLSLLIIIINVLVLLFSYVFITFSFMFTFAFMWYYNIAVSYNAYQIISINHEPLDVKSP